MSCFPLFKVQGEVILFIKGLLCRPPPRDGLCLPLPYVRPHRTHEVPGIYVARKPIGLLFSCFVVFFGFLVVFGYVAMKPFFTYYYK